MYLEKSVEMPLWVYAYYRSLDDEEAANEFMSRWLKTAFCDESESSGFSWLYDFLEEYCPREEM